MQVRAFLNGQWVSCVFLSGHVCVYACSLQLCSAAGGLQRDQDQ